MEYIQITEASELPDISEFAPFKAVIAIENQVSDERQQQISNWLVTAGALYVMLCGEHSGSWSDSVRQANLEQTAIEAMRPDQFVMITDHEQERLRAVFWHAKKHAKHTHVKLEQLVVLHVSNENRAVDYLSIFNKA